MTGASAACASAADQVGGCFGASTGGRLWALSVCDPCSAVMIKRLSVFGTFETRQPDVNCLLIGINRKSPADRYTDAFDPDCVKTPHQ
jgi:hypothetical protein